MVRKRIKVAAAASLALLIGSFATAGEIFQWTDAAGVIHFTDRLSAVPESARNSRSFVVRTDLATSPAEVPQTQPESATPTQASGVVEPVPTSSEPTTRVYVPQEVTIVFIDSDTREHRFHPCKFPAHCRPVFRPDFNNRQYIHPSVFNGGSRQYVHPSSTTGISRQHSRRR